MNASTRSAGDGNGVASDAKLLTKGMEDYVQTHAENDDEKKILREQPQVMIKIRMSCPLRAFITDHVHWATEPNTLECK
jgi:hypothetical protein